MWGKYLSYISQDHWGDKGSRDSVVFSRWILLLHRLLLTPWASIMKCGVSLTDNVPFSLPQTWPQIHWFTKSWKKDTVLVNRLPPTLIHTIPLFSRPPGGVGCLRRWGVSPATFWLTHFLHLLIWKECIVSPLFPFITPCSGHSSPPSTPPPGAVKMQLSLSALHYPTRGPSRAGSGKQGMTWGSNLNRCCTSVCSPSLGFYLILRTQTFRMNK